MIVLHCIRAIGRKDLPQRFGSHPEYFPGQDHKYKTVKQILIGLDEACKCFLNVRHIPVCIIKNFRCKTTLVSLFYWQISKLLDKSKCYWGNRLAKTITGIMWVTTESLGLIGLAVLMFIEYKPKENPTDIQIYHIKSFIPSYKIHQPCF